MHLTPRITGMWDARECAKYQIPRHLMATTACPHATIEATSLIKKYQADLKDYLGMNEETIKSIWDARSTWRIVDDGYQLLGECENLFHMFPQEEAIWTYRQETFDNLFVVKGKDGDYHQADSAIRQSMAMIADAIHVQVYNNVSAEWGAYDSI